MNILFFVSAYLNVLDNNGREVCVGIHYVVKENYY
jgi:hypothetical protein